MPSSWLECSTSNDRAQHLTDGHSPCMSTIRLRALNDPYLVQPEHVLSGSSSQEDPASPLKKARPSKSKLRRARKHALDAKQGHTEKAKALAKERGDQRAYRRHGRALCAAMNMEVPKELAKRPAGQIPSKEMPIPTKRKPEGWKRQLEAATMAKLLPKPPPPARLPPRRRSKKEVPQPPSPPKNLAATAAQPPSDSERIHS